MPRDVTVVIGNYEGAEVLPECLASIEKQSSPPAEVIVVDASSLDASRTVAESFGAQVIEMKNRGLGSLYNRGVAAAGSPFVMLLNNDVSLDERCLELLSDALELSTRFAADARQLDWAGLRTIHARTTLRRGALVREYLPGLHLDDNVAASSVTPTLCANGAAMMVRRAMFEDLHGFDETFFMEWEDLDLCWRGWYRGWPTVYVPDAVVRHRVGAVTTSAVHVRRSASSHHNLMRFALKCLPGRAARRVLLGELLRLPVHPRAVCAGGLQVLSEAVAIRQFRKAHPPSQTLLAETARTLDGSDRNGTWFAL
jgi:GT2 family glycosyltransferase